MRKKVPGQLLRVGQCNEVATANFLYFFAKSVTSYSPLKFDRKEAIVSSSNNMNGNVGPSLEPARIAENGIGFLAGALRPASQHFLRHVVQKVSFRIELLRVAASNGSLFPRFYCPRCAPPSTSGLAGLWNHRVD